MRKTAIITGITGQFASYLAENLLEKDYEVIGVKRRSSTPNLINLEGCLHNKNFKIIEGDITDPSSVNDIIREHEPDEFYNCAAQSHVGTSFKQPAYTFQVNTIGVLNCLESILHNYKETKFLQMSTSEMFGNNYTQGYPKDKFFRPEDFGAIAKMGDKIEDCGYFYPDDYESKVEEYYRPYRYQDERTPFNPQSPYAVSKVAAHQLVQHYRQAYNLDARCMIMFNCESPRRGDQFLTRKVTKYVAALRKYRRGCIDTDCPYPKLQLGNLDAQRDWGYAPEYAEACYNIMQAKADEFVVCTGETHSVKEFVQMAFKQIGLDYQDYISINSDFKRPSDVHFLLGHNDKIKKELSWEPKTKFNELVRIMVEADIAKA